MKIQRHPHSRLLLTIIAAIGLPAGAGRLSAADLDLTREAVIDQMRPFESKASNITDKRSLDGKVLCGYQGWFAAEGDGSGRGWRHYPSRGRFEPGQCSIDLWPDLSEFGPGERFETPFRHADGRVATFFRRSSERRCCGISDG